MATDATPPTEAPDSRDSEADSPDSVRDSTPDSRDPDTPTHWLSVAEAATLEGVTSRAIQRRAAAGKYEARRIETQKGEHWEINAATLYRDRNPDSPDSDSDPIPDSRDSTPDPISDRTPDDVRDVRDPDPDAPTKREVEFLETQLEKQDSEISFLRGLVEQRDRDAAELRAALREALRAMPKQLEQGSSANNAPTIAPEPTEKPKPDVSQAPERAERREPRPLWKLMLGIR